MHISAHVSHHSKGRTRLRLDAHKHDKDFLGQVKSELMSRPGVKSVTANPLTGSLLVIHDYELDTLIDEVQKNTALRIAVNAAHETKLGRAIEDDLVAADKRVLEWTGGTFDLVSAGFLVVFTAWAMKAASQSKWLYTLVA